jgi:hypothetical protein
MLAGRHQCRQAGRIREAKREVGRLGKRREEGYGKDNKQEESRKAGTLIRKQTAAGREAGKERRQQRNGCKKRRAGKAAPAGMQAGMQAGMKAGRKERRQADRQAGQAANQERRWT